ncbi:hypothetical protein D7231_33250 [Streptomyces klenkii]|uniref:Uncharacterized protein n=1 Tax=Streptomyces klenkii TaxID=1420899 RepID=A0A3B0ANB1_9ACTN|nr:hypothetical protein [Streptomyces klenkii]RKN60736.1 hypothetical protein D7231_33250 [Streptomyces klenkii]
MLAAFIKANHPKLASAVSLTEITDPVRLRKKSGADLATAASILVRKAQGKARLKRGEFIGIAIHEDMDTPPGPAYDAARRAVSGAIAKAAGSCSSVYALAAAESEAWLLLFPKAFTLHRPAWQFPAQWQGKDTGRRLSPKEDLQAEFTSPRYRESDGPEIVRKALSHGMLTKPSGTNRSYSEFVTDLAKWPVPDRTGR